MNQRSEQGISENLIVLPADQKSTIYKDLKNKKLCYTNSEEKVPRTPLSFIGIGYRSVP